MTDNGHCAVAEKPAGGGWRPLANGGRYQAAVTALNGDDHPPRFWIAFAPTYGRELSAHDDGAAFMSWAEATGLTDVERA